MAGNAAEQMLLAWEEKEKHRFPAGGFLKSSSAAGQYLYHRTELPGLNFVMFS